MTLSELQRLVVKEAYAAYFKHPTHAQRGRAKEVLADCEAPATAVLIATKYLLGPTFTAYEPETLWLDLPEVCPGNRDKLSAAIALAMTPSFYWDYRVFGATTHALTNEMVVPSAVPRCTPAQMAWTSFEAELLFALNDAETTTPEYDDPVKAYVGACLYEAGMITAPVGLGFCEEELRAHYSPETETIRSKTKLLWSEQPKDKVDLAALKDDAVGAQMLKLADTWAYVSDKTKHLQSYLASLA